MKSSLVPSFSETYNCYTSLVRPILEYAAAVWSPHLQYQIHQIEKVLHTATRFVTNDFSYHSSVTNMLVCLRWPLLEHRRNYFKRVMFYKILHGLVDASFTLTSLSTSTRGHSQRFVIPFAFLPSTINLWNLLPKSLVDLTDINHFKKDLSLHLLYILTDSCIISYLCAILFVSFYTVAK